MLRLATVTLQVCRFASLRRIRVRSPVRTDRYRTIQISITQLRVSSGKRLGDTDVYTSGVE